MNSKHPRVERVILAAAIVLAAAVPGAVQARPDFSGRWTIDAQGSQPGARGGRGESPLPGRGTGRGPGRGDMGSGWGSPITIRQTGTRLTVEYAFFARGDMQAPLSFTYALDGTPTKNSVMMGRGIQVETSTAAWDGDRLVITTVHRFNDPETGQPASAEVRRTLSLESDTPASLVVETLRRGVLRGPDTTTRVVYRRVE